LNKTAAYVGIISIVVIGLAGVVVLKALNIDAQEFIVLFSTTLPIAITAAITIDGLSKVKAQNAKIAKSVNGNTSTLISLIQRENLTPDEAQVVAKIEDEARSLVNDEKGAHVA